MRFIAYLAAVLIAAGTIYILGDVPNGETERLALSVPGMQCEFGCYPTVKKTLEKYEGVQAVELAKQESESELNDKTVFVTFTSDFDIEQALAGLKDAGFEATPVTEGQIPAELGPKANSVETGTTAVDAALADAASADAAEAFENADADAE